MRDRKRYQQHLRRDSMKWKLIIVLVIAGVILIHSFIWSGAVNAIMLFGLMFAGYGLGRLAKERRVKP